MKKAVLLTVIMALFLSFVSVLDRAEAGLVVSTFRVLSSAVERIRFSRVEKVLLKQGERAVVNGREVVKRSDLFQPNALDGLGRTNIERMRQGFAPIGDDGFPIELHHLQQKNEGVIMELSRTLHRGNSSDLHRYTRKSEIDRMAFEGWKKDYWKIRAEDF